MTTTMWVWMEYMKVVAQERRDETLDEANKQLSGMSELTKSEKEELNRQVESEKLLRTEPVKRIVQRLLHSQLAHLFDSYSYRVSDAMRQREKFSRVLTDISTHQEVTKKKRRPHTYPT